MPPPEFFTDRKFGTIFCQDNGQFLVLRDMQLLPCILAHERVTIFGRVTTPSRQGLFTFDSKLYTFVDWIGNWTIYA